MSYRSSLGDVDKVLDIPQLINYLVNKIFKSGFPIDLGFTTVYLSLNTLIPGVLEPIIHRLVSAYISNQIKDWFDLTDKVTSHTIAYSISVNLYMEIWDVMLQMYPLEASQATNDSFDLDLFSEPAYLLCASVIPNGVLSLILVGTGPNDMGIVPKFISDQMENFVEEMGFEIPDTTPEFEFPDEVDTGTGAGAPGTDPWGRSPGGIALDLTVAETERQRKQKELMGKIRVAEPVSEGLPIIILGAAGVAALILLRK